MHNENTQGRITHVVTCQPGRNIAESALPLVGIPDYERACKQHLDYCLALEQCGVRVSVRGANDAFANGFFIQSDAVVTEYLAVIGNFRENSGRQGEQKEIASALAGSKFLKVITSPGYLDCRDVLQLDGQFFIGLSEYTNHEGAAQLAYYLKEYGYQATVIDIAPEDGIRLGSAVTDLGDNRLLIREELARHFAFLGYEKILVPYHERGAANAQMINGTLIMPAGYTETRAEVRLLGIPVIEVNVSEFEKLGGGLKCLALAVPDNVIGGRVSLPLPAKLRATA